MRELRWYQHEAIDYILDHEYAGLFVDMGLGKTATILHAIRELLPAKVLLVGPIRVIETVWRKEATLWPATQGLRFSLLRGKNAAERKKAAEVDADIYLVNPELLEEALNNVEGLTILVIDESTLFKNPSSKRFKMLRKHLIRFKRRIISTGTPSPNSLMDLWSQVFILDRGDRLGGAFGKFQQKYFYPTDYQGYKFEPHEWAKTEIIETISDIIYRLSRADGKLEMLTPIDNVIEIELPAPVMELYRKMEKEAFLQLQEEVTLSAATAATAMMKLRQIASGFVYDDDQDVQELHQEKIDKTREILESTGSPVIVVYQFIHELEALRRAFPQGVKFDSQHEEPWNRGEIPLLFLHPQSGGHGINLQYGGYTMVLFTLSFSLEQMSQTKGRIDRQGQQFPPVFHYLIAKDTVDELLMEVLDRREGDQRQVLKLIKEYSTR